MGVDADTISVVSDSIQDWIDADDAPRIAGAESDYYQGLTPPYNAKNAPNVLKFEVELVTEPDGPGVPWVLTVSFPQLHEARRLVMTTVA